MSRSTDPRNPHLPVGVGVGILIRRNDHLLLLRRRGVHGSGTWSTPGGHLDFGETPEVCAIREAREETGLIIADVAFRGITNDLFPEDRKHYITIWMEALAADGEPTLAAPEESDAIDWFPIDRLPKPRFVSLDNLLSGRAYVGGSDQAG